MLYVNCLANRRMQGDVSCVDQLLGSWKLFCMPGLVKSMLSYLIFLSRLPQTRCPFKLSYR